MERLLDGYNPIDEGLKRKAREALQAVLSRKDLGFHQVPQREQIWADVIKRASEIRYRCDDLVVVGIGGSSLGPKALGDIFSDPRSDKTLHFCDNVDAYVFENIWRKLKSPLRTHWLFISKSGSTIETLVTAELILSKYESMKWPLQATVISEIKANPLTNWAKAHQVPVLEIPVDVGGRFSVLTAVGMLPMAFLGRSIESFRQGAIKAQENLDVHAELIAHFYASLQRKEWITFFWFYSSAYENFGRWLQQLWAESLAKRLPRQGKPAPRVSPPMRGIGSSDQHSLLQQMMEGEKDKLVVFIRFLPIESAGEVINKTHFASMDFFQGHSMGQLIAAQAQATRDALNAESVSTVSLMVQDLSAESVGFQLMSWQLVVAGLGEMLDVDAFDQPGVELGKRLAQTILKS